MVSKMVDPQRGGPDSGGAPMRWIVGFVVVGFLVSSSLSSDETTTSSVVEPGASLVEDADAGAAAAADDAAAQRRAARRARAAAKRRAERQRAERRTQARLRRARAARRRAKYEAQVAAASNCDPNYEGACLNPNASDYDCAGGSGDGPEYSGTVTVVGTDIHDLDADGDGIACD